MLAVHLQLALQQVGCLGIDNHQLSICQKKWSRNLTTTIISKRHLFRPYFHVAHLKTGIKFIWDKPSMVGVQLAIVDHLFHNCFHWDIKLFKIIVDWNTIHFKSIILELSYNCSLCPLPHPLSPISIRFFHPLPSTIIYCHPFPSTWLHL